jgi:hypothetical protein
MIYTVQIQRTITQLATVEIEASDEKDAIEKAGDRREDLEYSATDTEYDYPEV